MELQSSLALRNQKVYMPLKGQTTNRLRLNMGNIANLNRIFVEIELLQPLSGSNSINVWGTEVGTLDADSHLRMPIKLDGGSVSGTFASITTVGKHLVELDSSAYKIGELNISHNTIIAMDDYVICRVVATDKLTLKSPEEFTDKAVASQLIKSTVTKANNSVVRTGSAKTMIIEGTVTEANQSAPYTELRLEGANNWIMPYSNIEQGEIPSIVRYQTGTGNPYVRFTDTGDYKFYFDVSSDLDVKLVFSSTRMNARVTLVEKELTVKNTDIIPDDPSNVAYSSKRFILEKSNPVIDCNRDTFIFSIGANLTIGRDGYDGERVTIEVNSSNFPNLIPGSTIAFGYVIPRHTLDYICVITNKGQVYRNMPWRSTTGQGTAQPNDWRTFDESAIWDLPSTERKHPSNDPSESRSGYQYFPYLPSYAYELSPGVNVDNGYGNNGFGDQLVNGGFVRPRFYQFKEPGATVDNPFTVIPGGVSKKPKITTLGVYQLLGSRVCLWATDDGGRNWYVTYEFDSYVSKGNTINTVSAGTYSSGSFSLQERKNVVPTGTVKEPATKFSFEPNVVISSISNSDPAVVTTGTAHGLTTGAKIVLRRESAGSDGFAAMLNDSADENSAGTGVLFMVEVLTANTFELHEYIYNPSNNLPTRHIHYTHPLKDFIAFGTGEYAPNPWTMLMSDKLIDVSAQVNLYGLNPTSYRLNSDQENGITRACSFWMLDDNPSDPTVFVGSDTYLMKRGSMVIDGRTELPSRASTGILKGKLSDIDDASKFVSVLDIAEPNIYCMNMNDILIAGFQLGSNAVSLDMGESWEVVRTGSQLLLAGVDSRNRIYFRQGYCLILK